MVCVAVKVALSLDRAVILSTGLVQLYTDPFSWRKPRRAHEPHYRMSSIVVCPTPSARLAIVLSESQLLMSESLESWKQS
jgi:hypothetical protein